MRGILAAILALVRARPRSLRRTYRSDQREFVAFQLATWLPSGHATCPPPARRPAHRAVPRSIQRLRVEDRRDAAPAARPRRRHTGCPGAADGRTRHRRVSPAARAGNVACDSAGRSLQQAQRAGGDEGARAGPDARCYRQPARGSLWGRSRTRDRRRDGPAERALLAGEVRHPASARFARAPVARQRRHRVRDVRRDRGRYGVWAGVAARSG